MIKVAIIGGTGHENPDKLKKMNGSSLNTPYGMPSSEIFSGQLDGQEIMFLPRQGKDNKIPVTGVNHRANMYALKQLECSIILSTSTCVSLQEEIYPGEFVMPDQFIDFTKNRQSNNTVSKQQTFDPYQMARPFSDELRDHLTEAAIIQGITVHNKGTVITIEVLRYRTRAESNMYRIWGGDIIDLVTAPEVIAAIETGIPYAQVSLCTAYDNWRSLEEEGIIQPDPEILKASYRKITKILAYTISKIRHPE